MIDRRDKVRETMRKRKELGLPVGRPRTVDREKILELRSRGKSYRQIENLAKCSLFSIRQVLKPKSNSVC